MANTQIPHIQSHTTSAQDIWYKPPSQGTNGEEYIVYFVPGNPCIMTYYEPFLAKLFSTLNTALASRKLSTHVGGYTLPGFRLKPGPLEHIQPPFSLQDQVKHTEDLITFALKEHVELTTVSDGAQRPKVILVSHSMGTYITHEILKRHASGEHGLSNVDIVGAVLICAPLFEMAQTKNGAVVDVCDWIVVYFKR
jgi:pimeloyl-ACP methyl ester carboxylesterase